MVPTNRRMLHRAGLYTAAVVLILFFFPGRVSTAETDALSDSMDVGALHRLISIHLPQKGRSSIHPQDFVERRFPVDDGGETATFIIPGFKAYGCGECHDGGEILLKAAKRMRTVISRLKETMPGIGKIPLKQYIIQSGADELLAPWQFAHATFDTIRIFPRTILIDENVYSDATHLHETLHLVQSFVGVANELEAYLLNARFDPRFMMLVYPFFTDVLKMFYVPNFQQVLDRFFERPILEHLHVPREVQWYMDPFDEDTIERLRQAAGNMQPLIEEVARLNREQPLESAYLSEQTGIKSFLLEVAAVKHLDPPAIEVDEVLRERAFAKLEEQMLKIDNTRLGYKIDRKKEALLTIQHALKLKNPLERLKLYFHYLKRRFIDAEGNIVLKIPDSEDFHAFIGAKRKQVDKMVRSEWITPIEKQAGKKLVEAIGKMRPE